jgi:hypothetical protein
MRRAGRSMHLAETSRLSTMAVTKLYLSHGVSTCKGLDSSIRETCVFSGL